MKNKLNKKIIAIFIFIFFFVLGNYAFSTDSVSVDSEESTTIDSSTYTLLAPIKDLTTITSADNIGSYFSTMVKILIGICGVLAVIMLVIGGVKYMGEDSIFGKSQGRETMTKALFGLIIAIGSYALLNTINPDLLGVEGLSIEQVEATVTEVESTPWATYETGNSTESCSSFTKVTLSKTDITKINICSSKSSDLIKMINAAYNSDEKLLLSGYGSRSKQTQINFRIKNCGGSDYVYDKTAKCTPKTAIPGTSMHESGLAVDFRCNNEAITSTSNKCYIWLKKNASKYGFYNEIITEPWHWSTTGH